MTVQEDYILAFQRWCTLDGKAASGPKYVAYLSCLNKPLKEEGSHSTWDGLYKVVYGHFAEKDVVEIGILSEFEKTYGGLTAVFDNGTCQEGMLLDGFVKARDWAQSPEVKGPSCLKAALGAYHDFLVWAEAERKNGQSQEALDQFRTWLQKPERKNGKGYAPKTIERYVDAISNFDRVLLDWGIDLGGRRLCEVTSLEEFEKIRTSIICYKDFDCYNDNHDKVGHPHNFNGTGKGDPSAALIQFGEFLKSLSDGDPNPDKLAIALREFKTHRNDPDWRGERGENDWTSYSVNTATREYYGRLDEAAVLAFDETKFSELFCGVKDADGKIVFSPMWSGCAGQGWPHIQKAYVADSAAVLKFIGDIAASDKFAKEFCDKDFKRPGGFGKSVISELLMKFHPGSCFKYGSKTGDVFKFLGLVINDYKSDYDATEYNKVYELATDIRHRMAKLEITQTLDNDLEPDYLTVNEFVGWVFAHKPLLETAFNKSQQAEDDFKNVDVLTAALKCFQRGRTEKGRDAWESWDAWALAVREKFAHVDAAMFLAEGFDYPFFMRKFVCNSTVANTIFKNHTEAEKTIVGNFISQERANPHATSWYLDESHRPDAGGMGPSVMLNFMMKVRPNEFCTYSRMLHKMLEYVGFTKDHYDDKLTISKYEEMKTLQGMVLKRMHELGIGQTAAADSPPADYLTVNEFAWWLWDDNNQNLVKEKIMSAKMKKPDEKSTNESKKSIVDALKDKSDSMMARLTASLLTKPFVILAGASGTGKSRMVKKLAYMTCRADMLRSAKDETPGNYCMIAVKPNWHDSSELLGYKSSFAGHEYVSSDFVKFILRAFAFPNTPFFVCLDEMNLAPVEQYFAEYLSAVESAGKNSSGEWVGDPLVQRGEFGSDVLNLDPEFELPENAVKAINEKGLYIPQNLFVVGTVNMDDTTNQFSRKVLDRAMTILMNEVDFSTLKNENYEKLTNQLLIKNDEIEKFIDRTAFEGTLLDDDFMSLLDGIKGALSSSPFEIGYRFAIETALYREALKLLTGKKGEGDTDEAKSERQYLSQTAVDHLTLMKVLPRVTGTLTERKGVLERLEKFFGEQLGEHKLSAKMLEAMKAAATNNGDYISFWP